MRLSSASLEDSHGLEIEEQFDTLVWTSETSRHEFIITLTIYDAFHICPYVKRALGQRGIWDSWSARHGQKVQVS